MRDALGRIVAIPGRLVRNTSVATRLSLIILLVSLISLVITSVVGLQRGSDLADGVLRDRITSIGAARADEVERYMGGLQRTVIGQAISPSTAEAIDAFATAYRELEAETPSVTDRNAVESYYVDSIAPQLAEARGRPVSAAALVPRGSAAIHLQANYVVPDEDGGLAAADDGSSWTEIHGSLHQSFSEVAIQNELDDVYLIEPTSNVVVYSTAKHIDFGTSLLTGPQSGSALSVLINSFSSQPEPGVAVIQDFTRYAAAGDEPSAFVASPVLTDGVLVGFVAVRIGTSKLNSIMTNNESWVGQGDTGETYLAARDDLMRSDARGFIEDEGSYLEALTAAGTATAEQIRSMESFGTTVIFQPLEDQAVDAALDRDPELVEATNHLGNAVVQARRALVIDGLDWALFAEVERQEIETPIVDFARNLLIAIAVFIVVVTFLAVRWSDRLLQPLRTISTRLRAVRSGAETNAGLISNALPASSPTEFVALAGDIDTMLETLVAHNDQAAARTAERRQLLRRILPPQAVTRAEAGERDVVDQVSNASVVVIVIRGLGSLMRTASRDDARNILDSFVEEADALAKQRGLERIGLTGDAYFAACGTVRPHIDHAARAVSFALDVNELVNDLEEERHNQISASAAIDSGPVTVGLTGGSGLLYDAWGSTVQRAADLAHLTAPGKVSVSAAVRSQLPSSFLTTDADGPVDSPATALVERRTNDGAQV